MRSQQTWSVFVEDVTIRVEPSTPPPFPRDPKDEPFIAAALACDADYLITGDKDLLDEQPLLPTRILRPAEFARLFAIE
jgi:putative PIN family toxin of toxin-antitoxin system